LNSYTLDNGKLRAVFLDYGALIHELWVKDRYGKSINVIQGLSKPEDYIKDEWYRGAVVGRFAGRLKNPIQIEGKKVFLKEDEKGILLHSGSKGWSKSCWKAETEEDKNLIRFKYFCPNGAVGFPGNVHSVVTYFLEDNQLNIIYQASTDAPTHINLTNHAYFNLSGGKSKDTHQLTVHADQYLELDSSSIPTGKKLNLENTDFDFRKARILGKKKLDDYFVLNSKTKEAAILYEKTTGIEMKTYTNQPGIVIFTPSHFDAICFETQKFSDTPNIDCFPTTLVKPGEVYEQRTEFQFNLKNEG
jgi:aldose 1-epimerase